MKSGRGSQATLIVSVLLIILESSRGAPTSAVPDGTPVDRTIRIDDPLSISILGLGKDGSETVSSCRVGSDGTFNLPFISEVLVAGATPAQVQQRILDAYAKVPLPPGIGTVTSVSVTVLDASHTADVPEARTYKIAVDDKVTVSVFDLMGEGTGKTAKTQQVTKNGKINVQLIPPIDAAGLTQVQLEQSIAKAYADAGLIQTARVRVSVISAKRAFTPPTSQPSGS
jgi:protein involved in polysaccharide export with SLBB domain